MKTPAALEDKASGAEEDEAPCMKKPAAFEECMNKKQQPTTQGGESYVRK